MRITITIDDNTLYVNGKLMQHIEPGEQLTIGGNDRVEYRFIVYRKLSKQDKKIIKLADRKEAQP